MSNYIITKSEANLAVSIETVSSLLRLDYDHNREDIARVIRYCTAQVESTNGYALTHKTIVVTHTNYRIAIPLTPVYKICSVHKIDLKTSMRTELGSDQYECEANYSNPHLRILPIALSEEEQIAMGLAQSTGKKRYCKESRIQFEVEYEAGTPSTRIAKEGEYIEADKVPDPLKNALIKLVERHFMKCTLPDAPKPEVCLQRLGEKFFAARL